MYKLYLKAMTEFDASFGSRREYYRNLLRAIRGEVIEFISEPSLDELSDILHGMSRLVKGAYRFHYLMGGKAPRKLVQRYRAYGNIRSSRNQGKKD